MISLKTREFHLDRRRVLEAGGLAAIAAIFFAAVPDTAAAKPRDVKEKLAELTGGNPLQSGRISISLTAYTQYGRQVPIVIEVASAMDGEDRVKALHVFGERNTVPEIMSVRFGKHSGKARLSTRIRVASTQIIVVAAEMADGTYLIGKARCKVVRGGGGCG